MMAASTETSPNGVPVIKSEWDLQRIDNYDPDTDERYTTFLYISSEDEVYFGQSPKPKEEITIPEYQNLLARIQDEEIFPEVPADAQFTIAPEESLTAPTYIKRPGLYRYELWKGTGHITREVLGEVLIMEKLSRSPHPNIVDYHGCRVKRGRITAILLPELPTTLTTLARTGALEQIDKQTFVDSLESAVKHLHSLGLAHNDVNPYNIMVGADGTPVLIDFGSCRPFGEPLNTGGTKGWVEELTLNSDTKHDLFAIRKLREWIYNPE